MAKTFSILLLTFLILQNSTSKSVEKSSLEILAENAKAVAENVTATLGLQDINSQKVVKTINQQTKLLADSLQTIGDKLKGEIKAHQGEMDNVVKQVQAKLSETAESLKKIAGPENTAKFEELKTKFDDGFKNAIVEIEKLAKNAQPKADEVQKNIKDLAKNAYDEVLEIGRNIQTQVNIAIEKHEKTHKH